MKKLIFVTILVLVVATMTVFPVDGGKKSINYKKVETFMAEYYNAYNLYAQDAATIDMMDEYWAPEFLAIQYLPLPEYPVMDLYVWKNFMVAVHLNMTETLIVDELSIDTEKLTAIARLSIDFNDRVTGDLILNVDAIAFYNLKVEKRNKIKMTCLKLYFADPAAVMALSTPPPGL